MKRDSLEELRREVDMFDQVRTLVAGLGVNTKRQVRYVEGRHHLPLGKRGQYVLILRYFDKYFNVNTLRRSSAVELSLSTVGPGDWRGATKILYFGGGRQWSIVADKAPLTMEQFLRYHPKLTYNKHANARQATKAIRAIVAFFMEQK